MPDLAEMVLEYLKEHGYDGLYHDDMECGCHLDDLMSSGGRFRGIGNCRCKWVPVMDETPRH